MWSNNRQRIVEVTLHICTTEQYLISFHPSWGAVGLTQAPTVMEGKLAGLMVTGTDTRELPPRNKLHPWTASEDRFTKKEVVVYLQKVFTCGEIVVKSEQSERALSYLLVLVVASFHRTSALLESKGYNPTNFSFFKIVNGSYLTVATSAKLAASTTCAQSQPIKNIVTEPKRGQTDTNGASQSK